ncbi:MAG TPA: alanine racemase, partial [Treponemataceae bacterium]|nr:alanine racemase [Treponemataceae bacterium]
NAYGHGTIGVSRLLLEYGVDMLAVAALSEAAELRKADINASLLLFSLPLFEEIPDILKYTVEPFVFTEDFIKTLNIYAKKEKKIVNVHLKIDTGMGRIGCAPEQATSLAKLITTQSNLHLAGCCTHFATSDSLSKKDSNYTKKQIKVFKNCIQSIKECDIIPGICHCSGTGGTLLYPEAQFDMIRPGLVVYGYYPSTDVEKKVKKQYKTFEIFPVMELQTKITSIKTIKAGESVSYGRIWTANENTRIATIPLGYADGLKRSLSPGLLVLINGKQYPVVGSICMDQCMIDIGTKEKICTEDIVTIFSDYKNAQSLITQADLANTIVYEILTGIMPRVPRVYLD